LAINEFVKDMCYNCIKSKEAAGNGAQGRSNGLTGSDRWCATDLCQPPKAPAVPARRRHRVHPETGAVLAASGLGAGSLAMTKERSKLMVLGIISAVSVHAAPAVLRLRQGAAAAERLWKILQLGRIESVPFDEAQARAAAEAYGRYGKGIRFESAAQHGGSRVLRARQDRGRALAIQGGRFRAYGHKALRLRRQPALPPP
jgi:uncharacterized protein with PIN domain